MAAHAFLSPSAAHRWLNCPGAPAWEKRRGVDTPSAYADEGTAGHTLAERCLRDGLDPLDFVGDRIEVGPYNTVEVTQDLAEAVAVYVDDINSRPASFKDFEVGLSLEHITGEADAIGTADTILIGRDGVLGVHDLKLGRGVVVLAKDNKQLLTYAVAARSLYRFTDDITAVELVIHQPRVSSQPRSHVVTLEELDAFEAKLVEGAARALEAEAEAARSMDSNWTRKWLRPSDEACKWCKGKPDCPELAKLVFEALDSDEPTSPVDWGELMSKVGLVEDWAAAVTGRVRAMLAAGEAVPGWKIVQGRGGRRVFTAPEVVEAILDEEFIDQELSHTRKLLTPAQLEKRLAKKRPEVWQRVREHIEQPPGKPTLAPEYDTRPAFVGAANPSDFEDLDNAGT